jgi:hypothetical protein
MTMHRDHIIPPTIPAGMTVQAYRRARYDDMRPAPTTTTGRALRRARKIALLRGERI